MINGLESITDQAKNSMTNFEQDGKSLNTAKCLHQQLEDSDIPTKFEELGTCIIARFYFVIAH